MLQIIFVLLKFYLHSVPVVLFWSFFCFPVCIFRKKEVERSKLSEGLRFMSQFCGRIHLNNCYENTTAPHGANKYMCTAAAKTSMTTFTNSSFVELKNSFSKNLFKKSYRFTVIGVLFLVRVI